MRGQTLVLAALMVLVLAVAVLTTVTLGHTVNERVRLQNTSDAAAYSMAATEARAFNLYAFANRTQASHYVSAMVWQSMLSFIYFSEAFLVDVYGVMKSVYPCARPTGVWVSACPMLLQLPVLGRLLSVLDSVMGVFRGFLKHIVLPLLRTVDPDRWVGRSLIPAHRLLNGALAATSNATLQSALRHVSSTAADVIAANDPNLDASASAKVTGALSACLFRRTHMAQASGPDPYAPLTPTAIANGSKKARAKRAMAAVANATRFSCDGHPACPGEFVTERDESMLPLPPWLGFVRELLSRNSGWKWGQTKLLTHSFADGRALPKGGNFLHDWRDAPDAPVGMMAQGDNLGSDDVYRLSLGPPSLLSLKNPFACSADDDPATCWGDPRYGKDDLPSAKLPLRHALKTSIWALNDDEHTPGGLHYRLAYVSPAWPMGEGWAAPHGARNGEADIGLSRFGKCVAPLGCCPACPGPRIELEVWVANIRPIADGNHPWEGMVPFSHFEPGAFDGACEGQGAAHSTRAALREGEFNQPSSWVMLNKSAAQLRNPFADSSGASRVRPGVIDLAGQRLLTEDLRKSPFGGEGLNALSRAQTYYHRPGNWAEQPNFFNPYWRPRLSSTWQGRHTFPLLQQLAEGLPPSLRSAPERLITH